MKYHEGVPENFGGDGGGKPCLVILDDLLIDVYSKQVCEMFTRSSLHRNISVIFVTKNLFQQRRYRRDISLNIHYLVALKYFRGTKQFTYFDQDVYPEDSIGLYNAYLNVTRHHGYFILDLTQDTDDGLRLRTNILQTEYPPVVYSNIGD